MVRFLISDLVYLWEGGRAYDDCVVPCFCLRVVVALCACED